MEHLLSPINYFLGNWKTEYSNWVW